jgi:hypothetical protein
MSAPMAGRIGASDCERLRPGLLAQPVNAVTSLAYVAGAGVVVARVRRGAGRPPRAALAYAATLGLVGLGSVAFHGPQPPGARAMHDLPVVALAGLVAAGSAARWARGMPPVPGWTRQRGAVVAVLAALSAAAYAGGRTGAPTCDPDSPLQLHGAWHVGSAATFVLLAELLHTVPDHA